MDSINRSRQHGIFRTEQARSGVTVIGAGGIGSPTILLLAKMGVPDITVYDHDTVENLNLPSQLYGLQHVGSTKVDAAVSMAEQFADGQVVGKAEKYTNQPLSGVVITAVDSIACRHEIWEQVKFNPDIDLYIDARMGGQVAVILTVRPCDIDDIRHYESWLFPPDKAAELPCTERAIIYNTFGIASMIGATVRRWWVNAEREPVIRADFSSLTFMST